MTAKSTLWDYALNDSGEHVFCELHHGDITSTANDIDTSSIWLVAGDDNQRQMLTIQGEVTANAGDQITMTCDGPDETIAGLQDGSGNITSANKLDALRVAG